MTLFYFVPSLGAYYIEFTEFCLGSAEIKGKYLQVWLYLKWTHSCSNKEKAEGRHLKESLSQHLGFWTTSPKEEKRNSHRHGFLCVFLESGSGCLRQEPGL